ncbi:MAG: hypothetical protein AABY07_08175 [Nanoarchaeota archaeon]
MVKIQPFLDILKKNKHQYMFAISLTTTVLLANNVIDFTEKIIKYPILLLFSMSVFYFLFRIALEEVMKDEE